MSVYRLRQIILFLFAFLLYGNTISFDYTLDDKLYITKNEFTKNGISGIKDILTNDLLTGFYGIKKDLVAGGRYRPLSQVTYAIEWEFFGENPYISHLVNILLYAFTGLLLFNLLNRLLKNISLPLPVPAITKELFKSPVSNFKSLIFHLPFLSAILFLAHPLHTEVVANIKGRDDIMCLLGSLGALYFALRFLEYKEQNAKNYLNLLWSSVCLFLGILTKETAITFIAIIPVTVWFFTKYPVRKIIVTVIPLVLTVAFYVLLRYIILGPPGRGTIGELMNNPFAGTTLMEKTATVMYTCGLYIKLLIFPHPLTHDYYPKQIPIISWNDFRALIPLLIYLALGSAALVYSFRKHPLSWCFWIFLFSFSITSNFIFNVGTFMNERFMYIPSIGFSLSIAWLIAKVLPAGISNKTTAGNFSGFIVLTILVLYSVKTISRNYAWQDDFTLATTDVMVSANSAKCNMSAGGNLVERVEKEENPARKDSMLGVAIAYLNKATELHPTYTDAWLLKGNGFSLKEEWNNALVCYENVLRISQNHEHAQKNLQYVANKTTEKQQYDFTMQAYNILLKYHPSNAEYLKKMGTFHGKNLGQIDKAIEYFKKSLEINPTDGYTWQELGVAHGIIGKHREALEFFLKAKELLPDNTTLYQNIAATYHYLGDTVTAKQYSLKALEADSAMKK